MRKRAERAAKPDVWQEVASAVGGTVVGVKDVWGNGKRVEVPVDGDFATILLDVYTTMVLIGKAMVPMQYARAVASFPVHSDSLRLSVTRANPFTGLGKLFGMQDIEVGDSEFDRAFVVKGSEIEQVLRLLSGEPGEAIRNTLLALPDIHFGVSDDGREVYTDANTYTQGTEQDVVYAMLGSVNADGLIALHRLLSETLQGLKRIGVAQATDR